MDTRANEQLASSDDAHLFKVSVGANLGVTLKGSDGEDPDLYVKYSSPPTTEDYDAVGYSTSANGKVVIRSAQVGDYYIMVWSYRGSGDFDLKVETED